MINPHVHCRDWDQAYKGQTIARALDIGGRTGVSAIIDPLNTNPSTSRFDIVERRLTDAEKVKSRIFYGCLPVLTSDPNQVREMLKAAKAFAQGVLENSAVVGLKLFTDVFSDEELQGIMQTLVEENYQGLLVCHCEDRSKFKPQLWNPQDPASHSLARPEEAEVSAIKKMIDLYLGVGFQGRLHVYHVSTPNSVEVIRSAKDKGIRITSELTPHHCLLAMEDIPRGLEGLFFKVNPPIRPRDSQVQMLSLLRSGYIDCIGSDCAAHTIGEKIDKPYMSGFPGQPFHPHFIRYLRKQRFRKEQLHMLTHANIEGIFGINVPVLTREPDFDLHREYEVDVYKRVRRKLT